MAHTKSGGSTSLGRDSQSQRLGMKLFAGQRAKAGNIIVRQRGSQFWPGTNVKKGSDDTLYATSNGVIQIERRTKKRFDGRRVSRRFVHVRAA